MLKTKCIKAPVSRDDGIRISVMSRHTLRDGVTPDVEILPENFDLWWTELAPPLPLIGAYCRDKLWDKFEAGFKEYLLSVETELRELVVLARSTTVTIMCVEVSPEHCHRRLIAEACNKMCPELEVLVE